MTGTQRGPGEGQKPETKTEVQGQSPGENPERERQGKRMRRQGKDGQRDPRERHVPHPCPWPGLREKQTTSPEDRGQGPAASVSQSREAATYPHSLTGGQAPPPACPFWTPAQILPKHCSQPTQLPPGRHSFSELPLLGGAKQRPITHFWAL